MKIKLIAGKAWLLAKKFWWAIVLGLLALIACLIGWGTRNAGLLTKVIDLLDAKRDQHDAELETLSHIYNTEVAEKNLRLQEHLKRKEELKNKFEERGDTLDKAKEAELKKLVDESYNDPEKLAKQIADAFGL
tara:strand:- start:131 stop:529 length:399 start_codon:yes stop_codon:yes gene_type:complete